jgi:hypothetical protein
VDAHAPEVEVAPAPAAPAAAAAPPVGAGQLGARSQEEAELCRDAGRFDWPYLSLLVAADAGTIALDSQVFQSSGQAAVRLIGPGLVGLSWGWSVGGAYLTLPQCSSDWVRSRALEGSTRSELPLAISFTVLAAAMGPVIVGVETGDGQGTLAWSPGERVMRLVIAGATGAVGAVMPYVLPPRTWRALRKLDALQAGVADRGGFVGYRVAF